ncbi:hypothetical protein L3X38_027782 [Prunus dulcis]|uniref:Reverse transcriptase Ty1/copia-type domain-containing protein n=1 Tax=Prunus dulcis TaxID=3755 RepID=A0AAD4VNK4_PRUDU|nr:hypothetical protein L3X38_027782 [Prunus dulcis]
MKYGTIATSNSLRVIGSQSPRAIGGTSNQAKPALVYEIEPTSFQEANKSDQWRQHGSIERFKAHLVANGFHQQYDIDYLETFRPVVKHVIVCIILSLAFSRQWSIRQLDATNAFLHGYLSEEVYMCQPRSFENPKFPHHVCRLWRSLYGLKQSPRAWFFRFSAFLIHSGFMASKADPSLFIFRKDGNFLFLLIYVNDIIIIGNALSQVQALLKSLNRQFAKKDLRVLHYFLGIEVKFTSDLLCLTQAKYVAYLLKGATLHEANPCLTPVATGSQLSSLHGSSLSDPTQYHSLVGMLQYLTLIHLDISFAVNQVCQFMHQPTGIHWKAVKHILRYVLGTSHDGLVFHPGDSSMIAFSYANYDGNPDDCRFTGDIVFSFAQSLSRGAPRSSPPSPILVPNTSIINWLSPLWNSPGFNNFYKNYMSLCLHLLCFGVTTQALSLLLLI